MNPSHALKKLELFTKANSRGFLASPYSLLLIDSDVAGWSLYDDAKNLDSICRRIGVPSTLAYRPLSKLSQAVHYTSFFKLKNDAIFQTRHRIGVDYYHGKPNGHPEFKAVWDSIKKNQPRLSKIRISYSEMFPVLLEAGVPAQKIHRIPIGVDPSQFLPGSLGQKATLRKKLGIPETACVVGSFQKDGEGWDDGMNPKYIKGPDIFVEAIEKLKERRPEIFVLLTGPARGYVKSELSRRKIPFIHRYLKSPHEIAPLYHALDFYLISSREEGGPKAFLESLASGVPLVSTPVGQVVDLAKNLENCLTSRGFTSDELTTLCDKLLSDSALKEHLVQNGLVTAAQNSFDSQLPLWKDYFSGFVG